MLVYVKPETLDAQDGSPTLEQIIASALIRSFVAGTYYPTDGRGYPEDPATAALFEFAVETQVDYWADSGIEVNRADNGTGVIESRSLGPGSVKYAGTDRAVSIRASAPANLAPAVIALLGDIGTTRHPVAW